MVDLHCGATLVDWFTELGQLEPSHRPWVLLAWDPAVKPAAEGSWPTFHLFDDFGIVCARSSWDKSATHVGMRCGPAPGLRATKLVLDGDVPDWHPGTGHVHPDLNGLVIFDHGERLAIDPGYTIRKTTKNHNTITVDGAGQIGEGHPWPSYEPWDHYGRIAETFSHDDALTDFRGEAARGYDPALKLTRFDRDVLMLPDPENTVFIVRDRLESELPHQCQWVLNSLHPNRQLDGSTFEVTGDQRSLTAHLLRPGKLQATTEWIDIVPPPWSKTTRPGSRLLLAPPEQLKSTEFLSVLACHAAGQAGPQVTEADGVITVEQGGVKDVVTLTDGGWTMVRTDQGQVVSWAVIGGTSCGELFRSEQPVNAAWGNGVLVIEAAAPTTVAGTLPQLQGRAVPAGRTELRP